MIRRTLSLAINSMRPLCAFVLSLALICGCVPGTATPTPDPNTWPTWTFMVFLNGDNNLEGDAIGDFLEMAQVGSNDRLNVVVQMDRNGGYDQSYGDWDYTKRFVIRAGDIPTSTAGIDFTVAQGTEKNMGDPQELTDFIVWAVTNYPADHYMLVIWNHGGGWRLQQERIAQSKTAGTPALSGLKAVSYDETSNDDPLYMHEVGEALRQAANSTGQTIDVVGFDACLMGMLEVAYEIRSYADFMVASEETEPADGWPYDTILDTLVRSYEARAPEELAKIIVHSYGAYYGSKGDETLAAYDLREINQPVSSINGFVQFHNSLSASDKEWPQISDARANTEEFHDNCPRTAYCWGVDLGDFAYQGGTRVQNADLQEYLLALLLSPGGGALPISPKFVIANFHGERHPRATGVALYFPPDKHTFDNDPDHDGYQDSNTNNPVTFVPDSQWDNWLRDKYYAQFP